MFLRLLFILQSLDWFAAFLLELLQAIFFIALKMLASLSLVICIKYCNRGLPTAFSADIPPSGMFTTNSLCQIFCPINEWRLFFFLFLKVIFLISPLERLHPSLFSLSILFLTFFSSSIFKMHLRPSISFFVRSMFLHRIEIGPPSSVTFVFLRRIQPDVVLNVHFSLCKNTRYACHYFVLH